MAYTNNGTVVNLNYQLIPAGWSQGSVTQFETAGDPRYEKVLSVDMTNAVADRANTLDAIITQIESQVDTLVQGDFDDTTKDVTVYTELYDLSTNKVRGNSNDFLTNATPAYLCHVRIYVETAAAE